MHLVVQELIPPLREGILDATLEPLTELHTACISVRAQSALVAFDIFNCCKTDRKQNEASGLDRRGGVEEALDLSAFVFVCFGIPDAGDARDGIMNPRASHVFIITFLSIFHSLQYIALVSLIMTINYNITSYNG